MLASAFHQVTAVFKTSPQGHLRFCHVGTSKQASSLVTLSLFLSFFKLFCFLNTKKRVGDFWQWRVVCLSLSREIKFPRDKINIKIKSPNSCLIKSFTFILSQFILNILIHRTELTLNFLSEIDLAKLLVTFYNEFSFIFITRKA